MAADEFEWNEAGLADLSDDYLARVANVATAVHGTAFRLAPVDTEFLRDELTVDHPVSDEWQLYSQAFYDDAQEEGAGPHEIVAAPGKMLRFRARDGRIIYRKRVAHPGNPATHYKLRALFAQDYSSYLTRRAS